VALFAQFAPNRWRTRIGSNSWSNWPRASGGRGPAERTGRSVANASQHLQQMRRAGIVATRREGKFVFCTLADEAVLDLMSALRRIAE